MISRQILEKMTMSHSGPGGSGHNQGLVLKELGYDVAMTSFDSGNDALTRRYRRTG